MQVNYYQHKASAKKQNQDALFNGENILQQKFAIGNIFIQEEPFFIGVADGISSSAQSHCASYYWMEALSKNQPLSKQWIERHYADFNKLLSTRCWGSATTFAGASINPKTGLYTLLSVGDSRIYVIDKEDNWHLMTQDHNMLSELKPDLDEDDKQHYASLYAGLTSCFVADGAPFSGEITLKQYQLKAGETLLICTDGLTDYTTKAIRQGIWSGFPTWNKSLDYKACGWLERIHTFFGEKRQIYDDISVVCFYYQPDANSGVINI